jgi:hypothetical protein
MLAGVAVFWALTGPRKNKRGYWTDFPAEPWFLSLLGSALAYLLLRQVDTGGSLFWIVLGNILGFRLGWRLRRSRQGSAP